MIADVGYDCARGPPHLTQTTACTEQTLQRDGIKTSGPRAGSPTSRSPRQGRARSCAAVGWAAGLGAAVTPGTCAGSSGPAGRSARCWALAPALAVLPGPATALRTRAKGTRLHTDTEASRTASLRRPARALARALAGMAQLQELIPWAWGKPLEWGTCSPVLSLPNLPTKRETQEVSLQGSPHASSMPAQCWVPGSCGHRGATVFLGALFRAHFLFPFILLLGGWVGVLLLFFERQNIWKLIEKADMRQRGKLPQYNLILLEGRKHH